MSSKLIGADAEFFSRMVVDAANAIKMADGKHNIMLLTSFLKLRQCFVEKLSPLYDTGAILLFS